MDKNIQKYPIREIKENVISKTGYRALFLLRLLLTDSYTREELTEIFAQDPLIGKDLSEDTITNTINALRQVGCIIPKPNKKNNFKYSITLHPFSLKISETNALYLHELRKGVISTGDWQLIDAVNNLYNKLAEFIPDKYTKELIKTKHPLRDVDKKVLQDLILATKQKSTVEIRYYSAKNGWEELSFIPDFIEFENEKLYVWGYSYKYNEISYLRIDKIKAVTQNTYRSNKEVYEKYLKMVKRVRYELKGLASHTFSENRFERIISKTESTIIVEAEVYSEFNFIQKLLSYGPDCKIIEPEEYKSKFVEILKNIRAKYEESI